MKKRNILYGAIILICVISVIIAVYYQFFEKKVAKEANVITFENTIEEDPVDNPKDVLAEFNKLFTNTFYDQKNSTEGIEKYEGLEDFDIVYTLNDGIAEKKDEEYEVNANLPVINIASAAKLNETTQNMFADKVSKIFEGTNKFTIYNIDYVAYLNDNILSVVIKATLKEGNTAQRLIVQTYNYNIETNQEVSLNEVLEEQSIATKTVNKKIEKQVEEASKQATTIAQATGQIIYKRDLSNSMYTTDQADNFFIGKDGQIYIVYAYGNNNQTTEIDIIKV